MTRADRIALTLSLLAIVITYLVSVRIFEHMPHIEDEMAYVWQAQAIAGGHLTVPTPPDHKSFLVPFVVDYQGQRFGKYPLGWPALLAVGERLGVPDLINPLLAGLAVWLTYLLGKRILGEAVGLLAAGLTITSPLFLMNSGSLLSHPFGLVLSAAFALAWIDAFGDHPSPPAAATRRWLPTITAGLCLGVLALTRPLTALAVGLPFGIHALYLLVRSNWPTRRRLLALGAIALSLGGLIFAWQYAVTGDPFLNPYTLWWPYDIVGFGPGHGVMPQGHNLDLAYINTSFSLWVGEYDLFGWARFSYLFLPFGLLALLPSRRSGRSLSRSGLLLASVIPSLVLIYMAYWIGSSLFGPRYYYECLYSLTLLSAAGIAYLAGWPVRPNAPRETYSGVRKIPPLGMTALLALLVATNLTLYTPLRVGGMKGLYGVSRAQIQPFLSPEAQEFTPALIIVHPQEWTQYGALLDLETPFLDTPFIFAYTRYPEADAELAKDFPGRKVFYYYTDDPYNFYTAPRPPS